MTQAINSSFCFGCGDYLEPARAEIAWIKTGSAAAVCPDCKRSIYRGRIEMAMKGLNLPKQPPVLPLFTAKPPQAAPRQDRSRDRRSWDILKRSGPKTPMKSLSFPKRQ